MREKTYRGYYREYYGKRQRMIQNRKKLSAKLMRVSLLITVILFTFLFLRNISGNDISAGSAENKGRFMTIESALKYLGDNLFNKDTDVQQVLDVKDRIRVVIKTNDYSDIYHSNIQVYSDAEYCITSGNETITVQAGTAFTIQSDSECWKEDMLHIEAADGGEIVLQSVKRNRGNPSYEGTMDIYRTAQGLVIVNELPVERYLYRVVPSEMPASFGLEALKAQAVCARSYACRQMQSPGYPEFNADVDDSVSYQVYNNSDKNDLTVEAVDQTCGQVAVYQNEIIDAYFFSTSCGHTTDSYVWGKDSTCKGYLTGILLDGNKETLDLTNDADFAAFLNDNERENYDKQEVWYRWTAELDMEKIAAEWKQKLGTIQSITVKERGTGGVASCLEVVGDKGREDISTEYDIRDFLASAVTKITRQDGSTLSSVKLLPSGYFIIQKADLPLLTIYGGGYGHGAGLSQYAAKNMAQCGMQYEEILKYFYSGIEVQQVCYTGQ